MRPSPVSEEERLVAELELLGIRYLSRQTDYRAARVRPPVRLLADLVRQPSGRVREAVIAVFLAHPRYADAVPAALARLDERGGLTLRLFYMAAVFLQAAHAAELQAQVGEHWRPLSDLFSAELGLAEAIESPESRVARLGEVHRRATGTVANWAGTYENVAAKLLRRWELERQWSLSTSPMR